MGLTKYICRSGVFLTRRLGAGFCLIYCIGELNRSLGGYKWGSFLGGLLAGEIKLGKSCNL